MSARRRRGLEFQPLSSPLSAARMVSSKRWRISSSVCAVSSGPTDAPNHKRVCCCTEDAVYGRGPNQNTRTSWGRAGEGMISANARRSFAQAFQIALCEKGQSFTGQCARLGRIDDVLERTGDQHAAHCGVAGRYARHLVQDGKTAVDLVARRAVALDGARQVLAEAAVQKVIVIPDLEARLGEEVGEVLLEILINVVKTGPRFAGSGRFAFLHCGNHTPRNARAP